jgi:hypothetical protein
LQGHLQNATATASNDTIGAPTMNSMTILPARVRASFEK